MIKHNCARATTGHVTALTSPAMNCRRLIGHPSSRFRAAYLGRGTRGTGYTGYVVACRWFVLEPRKPEAVAPRHPAHLPPSPVRPFVTTPGWARLCGEFIGRSHSHVSEGCPRRLRCRSPAFPTIPAAFAPLCGLADDICSALISNASSCAPGPGTEYEPLTGNYRCG